MIHTNPFSEREMKNRKENILNKLENVDLSFVFNRPDLFYYSGSGLDGMLCINNDMTRYVKRNSAYMRDLTDMEIKSMSSFRIFKDLAKEFSPQKIGLELDILPFKTVSYIEKSFDCEVVDISGTVRDIRSRKSTEEQEIIKRAAKQTDNSFDHIKEFVKPGITELELSSKVESYLRSEGHPGFMNIRTFQHNYTTQSYVMSGPNIAVLNTSFGPLSGVGICNAHANGPSKRKLKNNETVLIDTTGVVEGYTADETATFFLGTPDQALKDVYQVAEDIHKFAEKELVAGRTGNDVYQKMVDFVREAGFLNNFMGIGEDRVQFIGHGIGLELDELPVITPGYQKELQVGNVIALEPKFIINNSGAGIEHDYIVGENNAQRITNFQF